MDAIARAEEETPAGERHHRFDFTEVLADTPELIDRTEGPLTDPGPAVSRALAVSSPRRSTTRWTSTRSFRTLPSAPGENAQAETTRDEYDRVMARDGNKLQRAASWFAIAGGTASVLNFAINHADKIAEWAERIASMAQTLAQHLASPPHR